MESDKRGGSFEMRSSIRPDELMQEKLTQEELNGILDKTKLIEASLEKAKEDKTKDPKRFWYLESNIEALKNFIGDGDLKSIDARSVKGSYEEVKGLAKNQLELDI